MQNILQQGFEHLSGVRAPSQLELYSSDAGDLCGRPLGLIVTSNEVRLDRLIRKEPVEKCSDVYP
jgi:hypothetical protein